MLRLFQKALQEDLNAVFSVRYHIMPIGRKRIAGDSVLAAFHAVSGDINGLHHEKYAALKRFFSVWKRSFLIANGLFA